MGQRRSPLDVVELERLAARGWRGTEAEPLVGGCCARAVTVQQPGALRARAGDPGVPLDAAVDVVTAWYAGRGLRPCAQLPGRQARPADTAFAAAGWVRDEDTLVLTAELEDGGPEPGSTVHIAARPDEAWLDACRQHGTPLPAGAPAVLTNAERVAFASVRDDAGAVVGVARGVVTDDWLGVTAVTVAEAARRGGLATALMQGLQGWAVEHGARWCYLQVVRATPRRGGCTGGWASSSTTATTTAGRRPAEQPTHRERREQHPHQQERQPDHLGRGRLPVMSRSPSGRRCEAPSATTAQVSAGSSPTTRDPDSRCAQVTSRRLPTPAATTDTGTGTAPTRSGSQSTSTTASHAGTSTASRAHRPLRSTVTARRTGRSPTRAPPRPAPGAAHQAVVLGGQHLLAQVVGQGVELAVHRQLGGVGGHGGRLRRAVGRAVDLAGDVGVLGGEGDLAGVGDAVVVGVRGGQGVEALLQHRDRHAGPVDLRDGVGGAEVGRCAGSAATSTARIVTRWAWMWSGWP